MTERLSNTDKISDEELFEKMRSKIKFEGYDYYKILGISRDSDMSDIKRKYRHLLAKYHPDKLKLLSETKRKIKQEQYPLIRMAGEVLTNPEKKKFYDLEQKTMKSSDISNQKSSFEDFIKLQESGITDDSKKRSELEFRKESEKINKVRGFNPDPEIKLNKQEISKHVQELLAQRDVESIELAQKNIFEGKSFNPNEFNNIFEKNKRKEEKKLKKKQEAGDMVVYEDQFTAFNDTGLGNFISVDQDYGDIYNDKQDFKDQSKFTKLNKFNDDDIEVSSDSDFEYSNDYSNYKNNKLNDDELKRKMMERNFDTKKYDKMEFSEFKSVLEDQFGISKDFGTLIGNDISNVGKSKQITSDMAKIYSRMIDYDSSSDDD
jgi:curved DNA-binding protein CbpA